MNYIHVIVRAIIMAMMVLMSIVSDIEARPGVLPVEELVYPFVYPSASHQTTVIRDPLGNQGTAYAYQHSNGFSSSAVAVSRSDNSKTLAYLPAIAPVVAGHQPLVYDNAHYHHHHHPALAYSDYHAYV